MDQTVKIKIQPLTPEAFEPYGKLLQSKKLIYPETEKGQVAMELLRFKVSGQRQPDGPDGDPL